MHCEEKTLVNDLRHYDMEGAVMGKSGHLFSLEVPGLEENRPSVMKGDTIKVKMTGNSDREYEGVVHEIRESRVMLGFGHQLAGNFLKNMKFDVQFTLGRYPLRTMHRAVALTSSLASSNLLKRLFPTKEMLPGGGAVGKRVPASKFGAIINGGTGDWDIIRNQLLSGSCKFHRKST